ncbi:Hypothetical protein, putative, partial [Bodo saltans]
MACFYCVIELGDPLGFLRYADKSALTKRIELAGGGVTSVVDERVALVISRDVTAEEFDGSLPLQQAFKANIPIVKETIIAVLGPIHTASPEALRSVCRNHLICMPNACLARLQAASTFTTLAKELHSVRVEEYHEATALRAAKEEVPLPKGWPAWTAYQLEMYDVVRQL